jgi:hypothetical protein
MDPPITGKSLIPPPLDAWKKFIGTAVGLSIPALFVRLASG